ncbi:bifunctional 4-hydroxy-2-oxoglutarate aldolase/2-dehydro-3-deoxy-phosphogluconate aldolase [Glaciihabitans sp. UYNi722]|uniref:bifunctional 4-hydroxy-2-oxoglutarate aldolase/2-dehydro-3-deoxy-phosphogluconate aldolase n=1 Tax=Glaciihabitans sp. UYNi722 TaxID=3156344 RepID=UPI0033941DBC
MTNTTEHVMKMLATARIVPVVEILDVTQAVPLAECLAAAGLPMMEVTLRTPNAIAAIASIASAMPDFLVGAGTLLTPGDIEAAAEAKAKFGVSPGLTPALSRASAEANLPFVPGAVTASEVLAAVEAGHHQLKFFPAEQAGGAKMLASFRSPFAALGIRFMPTGGVNLENLLDYLALDTVFAVGGTWIAPRNQISRGDFASIYENAKAAVDVVTAHSAAAL